MDRHSQTVVLSRRTFLTTTSAVLVGTALGGLVPASEWIQCIRCGVFMHTAWRQPAVALQALASSLVVRKGFAAPVQADCSGVVLWCTEIPTDDLGRTPSAAGSRVALKANWSTLLRRL